MILKSRSEPMEAIILRFLNVRMSLAEKDKLRYHYLVKGFEGEVMFDSLTEKLQCQNYELNDLLLEWNGSKFQLDSIMLTQESLFLFEVKNYEGDYYFEKGRFYTLSKKEIKNPLHQLERSESLLRQLLQNLGYGIPIEAYVVFINPEFNLYQSPLNKPIIYPNQLNRFIQKLNMRPSRLNGYHQKLTNQLISIHQIELPYDKLPPYNFTQLKKGNICPACYSLETAMVGKQLVCKVCGNHENIDLAVLRAVEELKLLFPDLKITTVVIHEWCGGLVSIKTIRRILKQNLINRGKTKGSFFL